MLYGKAHLSVRHAASTDETRYNLCGVRFRADGSTEATNGHWLLRAKPIKQDAQEFPECKGIEHPTWPSELEAFTLPASTVEALRKRIPKKQSLPILTNALLDVAHSNANGSARFWTTDLETQEVTEGRKVEGDYPNTDAVIPAEGEKPSAEFGIDLKYLASLYKAVKEFGGTGAKTVVKVELFGKADEYKPIRLTYQNPDSGELMAIIMPVRL